ncbi:hypothetical protein [Paeniglutamicibacter terrestris]|uniref:Uncharacterized protein n=1 Tax=Paeniglutamicibacter terrestris TaxID=2723403 RepID=A0ABX1G7Z7_9MICC|nr:hypothetical protein [Paeniglutamicibacter terrestris]NKG22386.1 hypothetical protein [Paeniglutamicibacter terrestris]
MSTFALTMPSKDKQPILHAANLLVESAGTLREINLRVDELPAVGHADKGLAVFRFAGAEEELMKVTGLIGTRIRVQDVSLTAMAQFPTPQISRAGEDVTRIQHPNLSFRQKVSLFLDGATSIMTLGSEKPKKLSDAEVQNRIQRRRNSYRRYIGGREE